MNTDILPGRSFPVGATVYPQGVNFCLFSKSCFAVELLLFDDVDDTQPSRTIKLDPKINKTFYYWHVFINGIGSGQLYGYRVYGPYDLNKGNLFDGHKVLLDPYTRSVALGDSYDRTAACRPGDNCAHAPKSVVVDTSTYDWEGDLPLWRPYSSSLIYELHVGGFTRNPNSGISAEKRGTYAGLIEKIPYLKDLGITAVELMPIQQFDEQDAVPPLRNYWGYSPMAFFAPHNQYSSRHDPLGTVHEFRDMVKAFHRAGIEVILDVVFNHSTEGDIKGPTLSFRGLENMSYYIFDLEKTQYSNYTGCGNTINTNHSIMRRMILDCLNYWVAEMHVDGFRFDLASVMCRGEKGELLDTPPILWSIESDPVLAGTKIIAEAWDAAGLYQLGSFIGDRFAEWNGQFRDDIRRFIKGDNSTTSCVKSRILGSPDIFPQPDREPNRSINFITCHDGFTLNDLVSYNFKHNEINGENNKDGFDANWSWNCGIEGPTDDQSIENLRLKQIKNFFTLLLTSQGTPMLLMGDEIRHSQNGNNNAYCQNNKLSWLDWDGLSKYSGLHRFVKGLINFIQSHEIFIQEHILKELSLVQGPSITWHGVHLNKPDLSDASHSIAFELRYPKKSEHIFIIFNAYWKSLIFDLPPPSLGQGWHRIVDTSFDSPKDIYAPEKAPVVKTMRYHAQARSAVILMSKIKERL